MIFVTVPRVVPSTRILFQNVIYIEILYFSLSLSSSRSKDERRFVLLVDDSTVSWDILNVLVTFSTGPIPINRARDTERPDNANVQSHKSSSTHPVLKGRVKRQSREMILPDCGAQCSFLTYVLNVLRFRFVIPRFLCATCSIDVKRIVQLKSKDSVKLRSVYLLINLYFFFW